MCSSGERAGLSQPSQRVDGDGDVVAVDVVV